MTRFFMSAMLAVVTLGAWLVVPDAARAEDRRYSVSNFERLRVEGAFEVRLVTGKPSSGQAEADVDTLDRLTLTVDGTTLTVRLSANGWGERPRIRRATVPIVTLTTPMVRSVLVNGGGRLMITGLKAERADLAVNGAGAITVTGIAADQLNTTVIGTGAISLAGKAQRAQLLTNGSGTVDAAGLDVGDLTVRLDGPGQTRAAARFTATVTNTGLGQIDIAGSPACTVKAPAGGVVTCGKAN